MIATLWFPDTNPLGVESIWPLCFVICYIGLAASSGHRPLMAAAPVIFTIGAILSAGFPLAGRRFPDADDYVGYYIWNLAACCCALEVARFGSRRALVYGSVMLFPMGWLLVFEVMTRLASHASGFAFLSAKHLMVSALAVWAVVFAWLIRRAARPYVRKRRSARGLCGGCGYDMRESPIRCPECGEPADTRVASNAADAAKAADPAARS